MQAVALEPRRVKTNRRFYVDVAEEQVQRLEEFRRDHPYQRFEAGGQTLEFVSLGEQPETVLLLPGAMASGESAWQTAQGLASGFRVIAPSYAPVSSMAELADGIARILDYADAARVHVVGGSYGGFVAQIFVRQFPERVKSMVISHAGPPDPTRSRGIRSVIRIVSLLPMPLVRSLYLRSMSRLLAQGHPESAFQAAYFKESVAAELKKRSLLAGYKRTVDFDENYLFGPGDLSGWPGRILLVMADDDPGLPEDARAALVALYPTAQTHLFEGTGHSAAVLKRDEYLRVLEDFIRAGL